MLASRGHKCNRILFPSLRFNSVFHSPQTTMVLMYVCGHHNAYNSNDCITRISLFTNMFRTSLFKPAFFEYSYPWRIGKSNAKVFLESLQILIFF